MSRHHCGAEHDNALDLVRCDYQDAVRSNLTTYAAARDLPAAPVLDLWAHLRGMGDDGTLAARAARKVIDLGWRPTTPKETP